MNLQIGDFKLNIESLLLTLFYLNDKELCKSPIHYHDLVRIIFMEDLINIQDSEGKILFL